MKDIDEVALDQLRVYTLDCLREHIEPGSEVALLDFPRHRNAGDSLIWLGTLRYLDALDVRVRYVSTLHHLDEKLLRRRLPSGKILINGGGNLGDRWVHQQAFKEKVLERFPDREIIQLPQSVEFSSVDSFERIRSIFESHPHFTLLLREREANRNFSRSFARTKVAFCPDLAFGFVPAFVERQPKFDVVALHRSDSEIVVERAASQVTTAPGSSMLTTDWKPRTRLDSLRWLLLRIPENVVRLLPATARPMYPFVEKSFSRMARLNIESAIALLSQGRVVATDRLHATVLARLMRIPVVASDNANHKISSIYRDYLAGLGGVGLANTRERAIQEAMLSVNNLKE